MNSADRLPPPTFQSIQVCRGIAALLVVLFHLSGAVAAQKYFREPSFNHIFSSSGSVGVCFFFVLSGFIITSVHWSDVGNPESFPAYLYKRFTRIYPIYWLTFFVVLLSAFAVPGAADGVPKDIVTLLEFAALVPQDPDVVGGTGAPVIIVAWSLQYEVLFYTFFGLLILRRTLALAFAAIILGSIVASDVLEWRLPLHFLKPVYFSLFGAGLVSGLAIRAKLWPNYGWIVTFFGAAGLVSAAVIAGQTETKPELIYGLAASLLIFGLASTESTRRFKVWKGWLLLGDSSYVLYLIHYPIISLACKIAIAAGLAGFKGAAITWSLTLAICIVVAALIHVIIEMPMMNFARALVGRTAHTRKSAFPEQALRS